MLNVELQFQFCNIISNFSMLLIWFSFFFEDVFVCLFCPVVTSDGEAKK